MESSNSANGIRTCRTALTTPTGRGAIATIVVTGDDAVQVNRPTQGWFGVNGNTGEDLLAALVQIRRKALAELKEAAYALGCNAVIGVDFDYLTLDPETATATGGTLYLPFLFAVTANGNAVVIEKNGRATPGPEN